MSRGGTWRWVLAAVGALVLVRIGVVVLLFLTREDPGAKPIGQAVDEFRTDAVDGEDDADGDLRPPAGVYTLTGEGSESISFPRSNRPTAPPCR